MKYTNKHLKESYKTFRVLLYISLIGLIIGMIFVFCGFIFAKNQMGNVNTLENVLNGEGNNANKTAYIDIIKVPQKVSEDKYEEYYLVTTKGGTYISGMQEEQYEALKKEVEKNGVARLEGFTKIIIDEEVIEDVEKYLNEDHIHIRVTELTYGCILKEGYIVNLILGGMIVLVSIILALYGKRELSKYKNPQAKRIDEECNQKDAIWLGDYKIYLTENFIVTTYDGIAAIDIGAVKRVRLYEKVIDSYNTRVLEGRTSDKKTITLYEMKHQNSDIYMEEVNYLKDIFGNRNIKFKCEIEVFDDDEM